MNVFALAAKERPDLKPRPVGRLHWQPPTTIEEQRALSHEGDREAFNEYVEDNRQRLHEQAKKLRDQAPRNGSHIAIVFTSVMRQPLLSTKTAIARSCGRFFSRQSRLRPHRK